MNIYENQKNIRLRVANTKPFPYMGKTFTFTEQNLQEMADTAKGVPISNNFDMTLPVIGFVNSAQLLNGELFADVSVVVPLSSRPLYLVPMVICDTFKLISLGVTPEPALLDLDPLPND